MDDSADMTTRLKWGDLTALQIAEICNGCGRKGGFVPVPDFFFTASCNHHDFKYWRGCNGTWKEKRADRKRADIQFLAAMMEDVNRLPFDQQAHFHDIAYTYYRAVRWFGWIAYNWGKEKTKEDLP